MNLKYDKELNVCYIYDNDVLYATYNKTSDIVKFNIFNIRLNKLEVIMKEIYNINGN